MLKESKFYQDISKKYALNKHGIKLNKLKRKQIFGECQAPASF